MTEEITREPVAQSLDALCGFLSLRRINVYDVDGAIAYDEPDPECTAAALRLRVQSADIERLQGALKSALAFIDRVEGSREFPDYHTMSYGPRIAFAVNPFQMTFPVSKEVRP